MGACHGKTPNEEDVFHVMSRLCSNRSATSDKLTVDNIIRHHTGEVVLHRMHHGNVVFPIFSRDLERRMLDDCPSVVVDDHVCCWNSINENLVGIGVTSPMFSNGSVDSEPWKMAPTWFCCSLPTYIHSFCNDEFNKNYSGFAYLPELFRMQNRLSQQELSTCTTCVDYVAGLKLAESEGRFSAAERYVTTKCTPFPDELKAVVVRDVKFEKVLRTNSALGHSLLASSTFKCLTVFSIHPSSPQVRSTYFLLSG